MSNATIHSLASRAALRTDEMEVQAAGGGASASVAVSSILAAAVSGDITTALGYTPVNPASLATIATSGSASNLGAGTVPAARMPALTGDVTTSAGAVATTLAANAVTLAKLAQVATGTFLGRTTAGTGNVEAMTVAQARTLIMPTGFVTPEQYGAVGDGTTDDYTAVQAAITAVQAAGGGTVLFGSKTYRINTQLTFTQTADTPPRQQPVQLLGVGSYRSGQGSPLTNGKGTILDLRSTASAGKIVGYGLGNLVLRDLTLTDISAGSSNPFVYVTNTSLQVSNCAFIGSKTGTSCDQDAIVCGGTTGVIDGTDTAPFQGYGTVIDSNYFNRIRRAVYGRKYFNANVISNNTIWNACGSNLAAGAAIELDGATPDYTVGNLISGNLIEVPHYVYGIKITTGQQNTLVGNGIYDATGTCLAGVYLASDCHNNLVMGTVGPTGLPYLIDAETSTDTRYISATSSEASVLGPTRFTTDGGYDTTFNRVKFVGAASTATVQPAAIAVGGAVMWQVLRSAAEVSNAGGTIFKQLYDGSFVLGGAGAGNIAGDYVNWTSNGKVWKANGAAASSGGNMEINSGSGGSYLDLKNYGVRVYDHTGTLQMTFGAADHGVLFAAASNLAFDTATGTKIGTATGQKLGFWNATPIVQPASASQAAITDTAGATYTAAEQTMLANLKTLVNQLRSDLVSAGLIKGAA